MDVRSGRRSVVEAVAGWSVRHRAVAIIGWFALVVAAILASALTSGPDAHGWDPGEAGRAQRVVQAANAGNSTRENVLIQPLANAPDPAVRAATTDLVGALRDSQGAVTNVGSPLDANGDRWISRDGRSWLVTVEIAGPGEPMEEHKAALAAAVGSVQAHYPRLRVVQAGDATIAAAVDHGIDGDLHRSETTSLPLTLLILLAVFGSLIAAGIPLLLAGTSVAATLGLLALIGRVMPVNSAVLSIVLLIGMAVGVDYSLFYLRREREERRAGRDVAQALAVAARTSGRAVVVSGVTVMVCALGLPLTGVDHFKGLSAGIVLVVGLAVLGSVTVLPALVAALGPWVDRVRVPWLGRRRTVARDSRFWSAVVAVVVRRPWLTGGLATLALVAVAWPASGMHLQDPAATDSLPRSVPAIDAAVRMNDAFPGAASPARVVLSAADGSTVDTPAVRAAVDSLHKLARAGGHGFAEPISSVMLGNVMEVRVPLVGTGTDRTSNAALETLRAKVLPATVGTVPGISYAVGGSTAQPYDFAAQVGRRTPAVFAFILGLAFILLAVAFRSLAIPLVSILLNLLSIGAAYGVLTFVFQDGHLASLLGFTAYGGVLGWLPLFMFVVLFGLSMDYHIFVLSRIRERVAEGASTADAIRRGISGSAGVVTSAAVIMTAVFSVFVTLSAIEYKMLGVGMGVAVLIDATIVRGVLVPAALAILGRRAWGRHWRGSGPRLMARAGQTSAARITGSMSSTGTRS
jgi:putative drug exporter of the RND superfamily